MDTKKLKSEFIKNFQETGEFEYKNLVKIQNRLSLVLIDKLSNICIEEDIFDKGVIASIKELCKEEPRFLQIIPRFHNLFKKRPAIFSKLLKTTLKKTLVLADPNLFSSDGKILKIKNIFKENTHYIFGNKHKKTILISFYIFIYYFSRKAYNFYDHLSNDDSSINYYYECISNSYELLETSGIYNIYYTVNQKMKTRIEFPIFKMSIILLLYKFRNPEVIKKSGIKHIGIFDYNVFNIIKNMVIKKIDMRESGEILIY